MLILASAAEPKYNFGSAQAGKIIVAEPGEGATGELYFYNVFGNKITFVQLNLGEAPEGWDIQLDPPIRDITYTVSGIEAVDRANVYVEPSNFVESPETLQVFRCGDSDCKYISSPAGGYMLAKVVYIRINAPKDAPLFQDFPLVVNAKAFWHTEPGTVATQQVRTFSYTIHTTTKDMQESIVTPQQPLDLSDYYWVLGLVLIGAAYYFGQKSGKKR